MYSTEERNRYFVNTIENLKSFKLVEGIVQIGSGVTGYHDEYSDIDMMVATSKGEDAEITKNFVRQTFNDLNPTYIKEKQFSKQIFLIIAILENNLEFNISIVPREQLVVRSPLWKVIVDKTGKITGKMKTEYKKFEDDPDKCDVGLDIPFEFVYCALSLEKAIKRNNLIYASKMLEAMRTYTLIVQSINENKKLHQFKAYDTLNSSFIEELLSTYPEELTAEHLLQSATKLKTLFVFIVKKCPVFKIEDSLNNLLKQTL